MSRFFQEANMATTKKLGLSVLAVLAVLLVGGLAWAAVSGSASGNKTRQMNGNMIRMGGGSGGGQGGMHGMNATALGLDEDATAEEIRAAMEEKRNEMQQKREQERAGIEAAIAAGDYEAWKTAVGNTPHGEQLLAVITEGNFARYAEMETYMTKARTIATELGLEGNGKGNGYGRGMGRGCPGGKPAEDSGEEAAE